MTMLRIHKLFTVTLLVLTSVWLVLADLRTDLEAFARLIPRRRISFIAAQHYLTDREFRQAWTFVQTEEFSQIYQQVRETDEVMEILTFLSHDVDVQTLLDDLPNLWRSFQMPMKIPPDAAYSERNLDNFLRDVLRTLPRASISALMARKVLEDGDFAKLYHALKSEHFKILLDKARHSKNLQPAIERLSANSINVDDLINTGFRLLSWGP